MRTTESFRRPLVATALALLTGCAATQTLPPSSETLAEHALVGRIELEEFDFSKAGYWAKSPEQRLIWRSPMDQRIFGATVTSQTCDAGGRRHLAAAMWWQLLVQSPDEASWSSNWRALREALRLHDAEVRAVGERVSPGKDSRVTDLARRVARDQIIRDSAAEGRWTVNLPAAAHGSWFALKLARMMSIDCENTEWLRGQLREIGWFDIPTYGATADKDAWLLVQHADRTPDFQREVLAHLRSLAPGQTDPRNLAYLEDRVAMAEGRPQRYGTQGQCNADGTWSPQSVEDPESVDARRATLGLAPMAENARLFEGVCSKLLP